MSNIERKLATIRKISEVIPIEGADNIELVKIDGWQCVVKKNEFSVGDWCVYFEVDSFLPVHPTFEFLRSNCYRNIPTLGEGFRLRTIRLRKQLSQGLALPLIIMNDFGTLVPTLEKLYWTTHDDIPKTVDFEEGTDCTEYLGIKKFELPIPTSLYGMVRGNFPSFIPKTDQERIQNCKLSDIQENSPYEVTMKLDGSSMTVYKKDDYVGVCSRNMDLTETEGNAFWRAARDSGLIDWLKIYDGNIAIQGELLGPGVQGNRENFPDLKFYVFDIFDIDKQEYLLPEARLIFFSKMIRLGTLFHAPILDLFSVEEMNNLTGELVIKHSEGPSINHKDREGIVLKSMNNSFSFKGISPKFLLDEK